MQGHDKDGDAPHTFEAPVEVSLFCHFKHGYWFRQPIGCSQLSISDYNLQVKMLFAALVTGGLLRRNSGFGFLLLHQFCQRIKIERSSAPRERPCCVRS